MFIGNSKLVILAVPIELSLNAESVTTVTEPFLDDYNVDYVCVVGDTIFIMVLNILRMTNGCFNVFF